MLKSTENKGKGKGRLRNSSGQGRSGWAQRHDIDPSLGKVLVNKEVPSISADEMGHWPGDKDDMM